MPPSANPSTGLRRNLIHNSAIAALCRVVTAGSAFFVVPFIIHKLGVAGYGVWEILTAITLWTSLLEGGIGGAVLRYAADAYARTDLKTVSRFAGIGITLNLCLACIVCPLFWFGRYHVLTVFNIPAEMKFDAARILPIIVALLFVNGANSCATNIIGGAQKTGASSIINAVGALINAAVSIVGIQLGYGVLSLAAGQIANSLSVSVGAIVMTWRLCPGVSLWPQIPTLSELRQLYQYGLLLLTARFAELLGQQSDKLILGALASATWVGYYSIAWRLAKLVTEFNAFIYQPIVPAAAALHVRADNLGLARLYSGASMALSCATAVVAVIVAGLHPYLEVIWLGRYEPITTPIIYGLTFAYTVNLTTAPGTAICRGIGLVKIEAAYTVTYAVLNTLLTVALVLLMGPLGTVVATVVSLSLSSLCFFIVLHKSTGLPSSVTLRTFTAVLSTMITTAVNYLFIHNIKLPHSREMALLYSLWIGLFDLGILITVLILFKVIPPEMLNRAKHWVLGYRGRNKAY